MTTCNPMINNKVNVWGGRQKCNEVKGIAQGSEDLIEILQEKHGSQMVCYE